MASSELERELWQRAREKMHAAWEYKDDSGGYLVFVHQAMLFRRLAKQARSLRQERDELMRERDELKGELEHLGWEYAEALEWEEHGP